MDVKHFLADPFSHATVEISNEYINTFPHPQGLMTYLHRLFLQLDVEILSLQKPVTVKATWTTVTKIDSFLKTLVSTLHKAIANGHVPGEEDFSAAFTHFEEVTHGYVDDEDDSFAHSTINSKGSDLDESPCDNVERPVEVEESFDLAVNELKEVRAEEDPDIKPLDKWYFNPSSRGKLQSQSRKHTTQGKTPPEPFVILQAPTITDSSKSNVTIQPAVSEVKQVLSEVYKKETIKKFHKNHSCKQVNVEVSQEGNESSTSTEPSQEIFIDVDDSLAVGSNEECEKISVTASSKKRRASKKCAITGNACPALVRKADNAKQITQIEEVTQIEEDTGTSTRRRSKRNQHSKLEKLKQQSSNDESSISKSHLTKGSSPAKRQARSKKEKLTENTFKQTETSKNNLDMKVARTKILQQGNKADAQNKNGKRNSKKEKLSERKKNEEKETEYECKECPYVTNRHFQLIAHRQRVHLTKCFKCEECEKEFGFEKDLRRHLKVHAKAENCCDVCGKMYKEKRKLVEHKKIHAADYVKPRFPCQFCDKSFSTKYVLAYHMKSEHLGMKRTYMCPTCGSTFSQKSSYQQHANVHLGIKPFTCEICGKSFSYEKSLKEHKFMHNEKKLFTCKVCNKSFKQGSGLTFHMKIHKETKDYICSNCGRGFNQRQALIRHERIHAGVKPYKCLLCQRDFADASVLRRHMILLHKRNPKDWKEDTIWQIPRRKDYFIAVVNEEKAVSQPSDAISSENSAAPFTYKADANNTWQSTDQLSQESTTYTDAMSNKVSAVAAKSLRSTGENLSFETTHSVAPQSLTNQEITTRLPDVKTFVTKDMRPVGEVITPSNSNHFKEEHTVQAYHMTTPSSHTASATQLISNLPDSIDNSLNFSTVPTVLPVDITSSTLPAVNAASTLLPLSYQQNSYLMQDPQTLPPTDLHQIQYSTVMTSESYTQAIVMFPDGMNSLAAYQQPGINISVAANDRELQELQIAHHINPAQINVTSSSTPHLTELSHIHVPVSSAYDKTFSPDQQ